MQKLLLCFISTLLFSGCYASSRPGEDAPADHAADPQPDFWADVYPDPEQEPDFRPDIYPDLLLDYLPDYPPDYPPDILLDIPPDIPFDGPSTCQPPWPVRIAFTIDGDIDPTSDTDITQLCTVVSAAGSEGTTAIELDCQAEDGERVLHTLEIYSYPETYVSVWSGRNVLFKYVVSCPWWCDRWFTLSFGPGAMAIFGVSAESLVPWDVDPVQWYTPITVTPRDGLCPWEDTGCSDSERLALDVTFYGQTEQIFDESSGFVGVLSSYQVIVQTARTEHNIRCTDMPTAWFDALFNPIPGG
jgi:hypothetical protein